MEFDLDSNRLDGTNRAIYAERFYDGCLYKARPDVMSVCHSHAHAVVPFTVTNTPIEPIWVMASGSGSNVPNWDIRAEFPNEGTMLVVNDATGQSLARKLGAGRVCLLRGHGAVIATSELKATVMVSIGLMCNAAMLIQAHTLSQGRGDAAVKRLRAPPRSKARARYCSARSGWSRRLGVLARSRGLPGKRRVIRLLHRLEPVVAGEPHQRARLSSIDMPKLANSCGRNARANPISTLGPLQGPVQYCSANFGPVRPTRRTWTRIPSNTFRSQADHACYFIGARNSIGFGGHDRRGAFMPDS